MIEIKTPTSPAKPSRHFYREKIRMVIQTRIALGLPLNHRDILQAAGGGSASTVVDELKHLGKDAPATLIGRGAKSLPQRIVAIEDALNNALAREAQLAAENIALKNSLHAAQEHLNKLLATHQDAQRMLFQSVDDLRQMVKRGQGGMLSANDQQGLSEAILWKTRHDQLQHRLIALEADNRKMANQLVASGSES